MAIQPDTTLLEPLRKELLKLKSESTHDFLDDKELDSFLEDDSLSRFLVARRNDFNKAIKMARDALTWRCTYHQSKLTVGDFETANSQGVWRFMGYAKNGAGAVVTPAVRDHGPDLDIDLPYLRSQLDTIDF